MFAIAVALRLPICHESFWLDELHSAWSFWGTWREVMPRAAAGNQTPVYFAGMWLWKQLAGDSEWALRLPSVIASSLAASVITIGIAKHRGSLFAGCLAGLVMALESNSLFYGTELRPFAFSILFGAVACYLASSESIPPGQKLSWLVIITICSGLFQPTSMGVLGCMVLAQLIFMSRSRDVDHAASLDFSSAVQKWVGFVIVGSALLLVWLAGGVLYEAWRHREQWQSMGRAETLWQCWTVWPWLALVVLPACLALMSRVGSQRQNNKNRSLAWWAFALVAVAATMLFWSISFAGIAPIFHRRYFIACLPILVWFMGDAIATMLRNGAAASGTADRSADSSIARRPRPRSLFLHLLALAPLVLLLSLQPSARKLLALPSPLVSRGEGWRELVAHLRSYHSEADVVYLNPGLIESSRLLSTSSRREAEVSQWYLTNPLQGPYRWPHVVAFDHSRTLPIDFPIVLRGNRVTAENWLKRPIAEKLRDRAVIQSFGGVQLIEKRSPQLPNP